MGSDVTAKALRHQIPRFKAIGKLQLEALESGSDPKDVDLGAMAGGSSGQKLGTSFILSSTFSLLIFILHLIMLALLETTILMLRQTSPSTLVRTVLLVA
jgi:hypothetical protein